MKYGTLQFIAGYGVGGTREIEFNISPIGDDVAVSISVDGEQPMLIGNKESLKILKDFIAPWMETQNVKVKRGPTTDSDKGEKS